MYVYVCIDSWVCVYVRSMYVCVWVCVNVYVM